MIEIGGIVDVDYIDGTIRRPRHFYQYLSVSFIGVECWVREEIKKEITYADLIYYQILNDPRIIGG